MNKSIKTVALSVFTILFVGLLMFFIFRELLTEEDIKTNNNNEITSAEKFKKEYEKVNGTTVGDNKVRSLSISESNPMVYASIADVNKMIENGDSFLVYFGYAKCPWCRSVIESMLAEAKEHNIDKIYYVDIEKQRDEIKLNENHEKEVVNAGSEDYKVLINNLANILDDYEALTYYDENGKEVSVEVGEKRVYAPNIIFVKDGKGYMKMTGVSTLLEDPYVNLSEDMVKESKSYFHTLFTEYNNASNVCFKDKC